MAFPDLQTQVGYGDNDLPFRWAEFVSKSGNTADASLGYGGVGLGMCMLIYTEDLDVAVQKLLGYSYRDDDGETPRLRRILPFRHPRWGQLWCTRIVRAVGVQVLSKQRLSYGPLANHTLMMLTLQFTRPPYNILPDSDIPIVGGIPQEWLRYTDRHWQPSVQMLSREGMIFKYSEGNASGRPFPGAVGQKLAKLKLTRKWYQLPEPAIYNADGFPSNILTNPGASHQATDDTKLAAAGAGYAINDTITLTGGTFTTAVQFRVLTVGGGGAITSFEFVSRGEYSLLPANPVAQGATSGGGAGATFDVSWTQPLEVMLASVNNSEFFGCPEETLLYETCEITPQAPPLPPELMDLGVGEGFPLQFDVTFHFEYFNPPLGTGAFTRGHNCMPWAADGRWYRALSQVGNVPPFPAQDFAKLWTVL